MDQTKDILIEVLGREKSGEQRVLHHYRETIVKGQSETLKFIRHMFEFLKHDKLLAEDMLLKIRVIQNRGTAIAQSGPEVPGSRLVWRKTTLCNNGTWCM